MNIQELKSRAYDIILQIEALRQELGQIQQIIMQEENK